MSAENKKNENFNLDGEVDIRIPLPHFHYSNNTITKETTGMPYFFGRRKELKRFINILIEGYDNYSGGSFLVSGYRGVGKTRFVNQALCIYKKEINKKNGNKDRIIDVHINLGSDSNLNSKNVLFNMVSSLHRSIVDKLKKIIDNDIEEVGNCKCLSYSIRNFFLRNIHFLHSKSTLATLWAFTLTLSFLFLSALLKSPIDKTALIYIFIMFFSSGGLILLNKLYVSYFDFLKPIRELEILLNDMTLSSENNVQMGSKFFGFGRKLFAKPLDNNQIESRLRKILSELNPAKLDILFIFDELDKLSGSISEENNGAIDLIKESRLRKQQVDSILGDLKNLTTNSMARYIFIAGRDMYDAYLSERGSTNSLYESLFHDHIYIPSLLTDRSDNQVYLLDSMIETFVVSNLISPEFEKPANKLSAYKMLSDYVEALRKESKVDKECQIERIYILKTFIHFLALHSWGNFKRLIRLFESFVVLASDENGESKYELYFSTKDIQRLVLASHLYILFHHNLSRMLMNADDKLVVSSFSVFHYILKYHGIGFSRAHILRMYETINLHSSPELTRIVDIIIHNVLRNHVRRIRNSFYRYRFSFLHEQEIHFITTISDGESAAFNFSLNAMDAVKQHYKNLIIDSKYTHANEYYGHVALASIHVIVGNFHFWEQSYDEAMIQYGIALDILERQLSLKEGSKKIDVAVQLIEVYLKQGSVVERIGNYTAASSIYMRAKIIANSTSTTVSAANKDSKWDILRQPKWAIHYLDLKQSAIHYCDCDHIVTDETSEDTDVFYYRKATLSFFLGNFPKAYTGFLSAINLSGRDQDGERACFLRGNAYLKAGFSLLLKFSNDLQKKIKKSRAQYTKPSPKESLKAILPILIDNIYDSVDKLEKFTTLETLEDIEKNEATIESLSSEGNLVCQAFGLIKLSELSFMRGRLNGNAAISCLSIVMVWEAILEMLPWKKIWDNENNSLLNIIDEKTEKRIECIKEKISNIRNKKCWLFEAQERAFTYTAYNTNRAFSHFMKTALFRNLKLKIAETIFSEVKTSRKMVLDSELLKNNLYQHYSVFGQAMIASIYWEQITAGNVDNSDTIDTGSLMNGKLLPYGIRYYSTMLWLKGRVYLNNLLKINEFSDELELKKIAANAIINLFRSSQYVTKTHGETASMTLPPIFFIYYNMWEVLFRLVFICRKKNPTYSFEKAMSVVRDEMDKVLISENVMDVSSRVLDLKVVEQMALEHIKIVERMNDQNSKDKTNIMRKKYYLDDDYEDTMFNLDWCYCLFFAPSAIVYRMIIENETQWLKQLNG